MRINKIILAKPRGFCAGVERAIDVVEECLEIFGKPVYVKHEIVHNKHVVDRLTQKGAITVDSIEEIPSGAIAVFSAHGSPPEHFIKAKERGIKIIDATCPLVTRVHIEVHMFTKKDYKIIYIGHKGHVLSVHRYREACIPVLCDLIEGYGNRVTADLYVNSHLLHRPGRFSGRYSRTKTEGWTYFRAAGISLAAGRTGGQENNHNKKGNSCRNNFWPPLQHFY